MPGLLHNCEPGPFFLYVDSVVGNKCGTSFLSGLPTREAHFFSAFGKDSKCRTSQILGTKDVSGFAEKESPLK